jgi:predicted lipoprotein
VSATSRDEVVAAVLTSVIRPGYAALDDAVGTLVADIDGLCADVSSSAALATSQESWRAAREAWMATRAYRIGPTMDLRSMSKIDFSIDPAKIDRLLSGVDPVDRDAVAALGSDQRGLGGVEVALFRGVVDARSCAYALSAATLVNEATSALTAAWSAETLGDSKVAIDALVNGAIFALVDAGDQRIGKASGAITGTPSQADVDSGPAHSAIDDTVTIITSVQTMLGDGSGSMMSLIEGQSAEAAARLLSELEAARVSVDGLARPLATNSDTAALTESYALVQSPLRTLRAEVASLLGVSLTFGDADGDS